MNPDSKERATKVSDNSDSENESIAEPSDESPRSNIRGDDQDGIDSELAACLTKSLHISEEEEEILSEQTLDGIVNYIKKKEGDLRIITMVGAGISTAAGIPDFRSPGSGIYHNLQKYNLPYPSAIFEKNYFLRNPEPFFLLVKEMFPSEAYVPTTAHLFIRLLQEKGLLLRHYTQNIDNLDRLAGIDDDILVEAHGTFHCSHCVGCKAEYSLDWLKDMLKTTTVPKCPQCEKVVKPDIVFFGESLPTKFYENIRTDFSKCNLLIIMGSSLLVEPFASLVNRVKKNCPRILINLTRAGEDVGLDFNLHIGGRDVLWLGTCDDGVKELAQKLDWENELNELVNRNTNPTQD